MAGAAALFARPVPPLAAGPAAAKGGATSMMDVSDGLLADLGHLAEASAVAVNLETDQFVVSDAIARVCAATGKSPWGFVLAGGEDHALVATFPAEVALPQGWSRVGSVLEGAGLTVDGQAWEGAAGWDHFAR